MAAKYLPGEQATIKLDGVLDSQGNAINATIIYNDIYNTLMSKSIGKWRKAEMITQMPAGSTMVFFRNNNFSTADYVGDGSKIRKQKIDSLYITVDANKECNTEIPLVDAVRMGAKSDGPKGLTIEKQYLASFETNVANAILRLEECLSLQTAVNAAKDRPANSNWIVDPETNTADKGGIITLSCPSTKGTPDINGFRSFYAGFSNPIQMLNQLIGSYYFGIDPKDGYLLVSPRVMTAMAMTKSTLGSDRGFETMEKGLGDEFEVGGIQCLKCPLLGTKVSKGNFTDLDQEFDFTGLDLLWVHKEAIKVPFIQIANGWTLNTDNYNPRFINTIGISSKGGIAIYPELVIGFQVIFGSNFRDQTTYNNEIATLNAYLSNKANKIVAASGTAIETPLLAKIKGLTTFTVIDVSQITDAMITTNPVNAATVGDATTFDFTISTLPIKTGKLAIQTSLTASAWYANA